VQLLKNLRNVTIGALIAAVPLTSSIAATRPNAAVPMAGSAASTAATAESGIGGDHSYNWVAFALGIAAIALFALLVLDDDGDDDDAVSAG
jgi:hypothetical protein